MKGIGADVVSVSRMRTALRRTPTFAGEVFSARERAFCDARRVPAADYATRFAAKEAFLKALGIGLLGGVALPDIEVGGVPGGRPCLELGPTAAAALSRAGGEKPFLSLTHDGDVAFALVVVP